MSDISKPTEEAENALRTALEAVSDWTWLEELTEEDEATMLWAAKALEFALESIERSVVYWRNQGR